MNYKTYLIFLFLFLLLAPLTCRPPSASYQNGDPVTKKILTKIKISNSDSVYINITYYINILEDGDEETNDTVRIDTVRLKN